MPGSLKKMSPQTVAAITPVTRKSNCSITEPMMLASATLKICNAVGLAVGLAVVSFMVSHPLQDFHAFPGRMARGEDAQADRRQHGRGDQPSLAGKKDTVAKSPMQIIANGGRLNQPLQRRWMAA